MEEYKRFLAVYKYLIVFDGDDILTDYQFRFVAAYDDFEADAKMERYRKNLVKKGFSDFRYVLKGVEIDNIII